MRACYRNHDEGQCRQNATIHRIAVKGRKKAGLGTVWVQNKEESPGTLEFMVIRHKPTNNCRQTVVRRLEKRHEIDKCELSQSTTHFPFRAEPSRRIFPSFLNVSSALLTCAVDSPVFSTIAVREIEGFSCSNTSTASALWLIS